VQGHQRPRVCLVPEITGWDTAEIALEICELAGLDLDPWQQFLLTSSLGEREDGKWAAFEVGVVVPRQNGKGGTLEAGSSRASSRSTRSA
jgi:phage terminase large subunit-like protein